MAVANRTASMRVEKRKEREKKKGLVFTTVADIDK